MSRYPADSGIRSDLFESAPVLIFIQDGETIREKRDNCPRCGATWDTWWCSGIIEEGPHAGVAKMFCQCGLKFGQMPEHLAEGAGDDHAD